MTFRGPTVALNLLLITAHFDIKSRNEHYAQSSKKLNFLGQHLFVQFKNVAILLKNVKFFKKNSSYWPSISFW